jgi:hypothetical protein
MIDRTVERSLNLRPVIVVAVAVALAGLGGWFYWRGHNAALPQVPEEAQPAVSAPAPEPRILHPLPTAGAVGSEPLPELNDSDWALREALNDAAAGAPIAQYLVPESLIRHLVVTVDNLPRQKVAVDKRPLVPTPGIFLADGDELHATLDRQNFKRYDGLVEVVRKADMRRVAAVYLRFYPLFQSAYQDLGYPKGYFNDRLVEVIDSLLAAPQLVGPIDLVRPNVMYLFADPHLEALPAGQKVLIRMGPDNATAIKTKLMELRAIVTAAAPKH